ncbi:hypothetical protein BCR44DRAFT_387926 [Catenaria anguillulae PL171]|uniref:Uncharacterized protein n=1 Tax=Catenaria anguillulae PL171 TaxID=765915 RepID=A0A1Y2HY96_9FUNG|nr:hypothetical protein BCR44DRAFT_387926 [Catenaria anguillulae PL171]
MPPNGNSSPNQAQSHADHSVSSQSCSPHRRCHCVALRTSVFFILGLYTAILFLFIILLGLFMDPRYSAQFIPLYLALGAIAIIVLTTSVCAARRYTLGYTISVWIHVALFATFVLLYLSTHFGKWTGALDAVALGVFVVNSVLLYTQYRYIGVLRQEARDCIEKHIGG